MWPESSGGERTWSSTSRGVAIRTSRSRRTRSALAQRKQRSYLALIPHPRPPLTKCHLEWRPCKECFPGGPDRARALPDRRISDTRRAREVGEAYLEAGADVLEIGVP